MSEMFKKVGLLASASVMGMLVHGTGQAAEAAGAGTELSTGALEEIVVTAQKRSENLQKIPFAITAASGEELRKRNVTSVQSLSQLVPNMNFNETNGNARVTLRGLGLGNSNLFASPDPRIAVYLNGVYLARPGDMLSGFYDIDRVEVLRGPQGTLFGRNATGGAVSLITRQPTETTEGYVQADIGNYGTMNLEGAISGAIAPNVTARLSFKTEDHDDYSRNLTYPNGPGVDNKNTRAFRGQLKIEPSSTVEILLAADYFKQDDRSFPGRVVGTAAGTVPPGERFGGLVFGPNSRDVYSDVVPDFRRKSYGASATINIDLPADLKLVSISAYRRAKQAVRYDLDGSSQPLFDASSRDTSRQISEEIRLSQDDGAFRWMVGGYYFSEKSFAEAFIPIDARFILGATAAPGFLNGLHSGGRGNTRALAAFSQATYNFTDRLSLTGGLRYSSERKRITDAYINLGTGRLTSYTIPAYTGTPFSTSITFNDLSPRISLQYDISSRSMVYATYSRGFKSGGLLLGQIQPPFRAEKVKNYEVGFKSELFDRRVRINGTGFYYDYSDLQVQVTGATLVSGTVNAAAAKIYGVELELSAVPVDGLTLNASGALTKSEFTRFLTTDPARPALGILNLKGKRLPYAPKWTLTLGAQYAWDTSIGQLTLRGETNASSNMFFDAYNTAPMAEGGYAVANFFLNWESRKSNFYGSFYLKNAFGSDHWTGKAQTSPISSFVILGSRYAPRTYGLTAGFRL